MARSKTTFQIHAEYLPVRALFALLSVMPLPMAERAGIILARLIFLFLPKRRQLAQENLSRAFPLLDKASCARIASESIRYLGRGIGMVAHIPELARNGFEGTVDLIGYEHIDAAARKGRGILCFSAHYGSWEMIAGYVPAIYTPAGMVVRILDNPKLEALVYGIRSSTGGIVISRNNIFREGLRLLRQNGMLGILMDQNTAKGGIFLDFFGRLAATTTAVSLLARRTGASVLPMHTVWAGDKIRIIVEPPLALSGKADPEQAQAEDTQRMTSVIEGWIRQDPAQWLWVHNRWKRQPDAMA